MNIRYIFLVRYVSVQMCPKISYKKAFLRIVIFPEKLEFSFLGTMEYSHCLGSLIFQHQNTFSVLHTFAVVGFKLRTFPIPHQRNFFSVLFPLRETKTSQRCLVRLGESMITVLLKYTMSFVKDSLYKKLLANQYQECNGTYNGQPHVCRFTCHQ